MGLDIYLLKCDDLKKELELQDKYSKKQRHLLENNGKELTESLKKKIHVELEAFALSLNLDKYGVSQKIVDINQDSKIDPSHCFKLGYFRSSYNESGINRVLQNMNLQDLYDVFNNVEEDYYFTPDWPSSLDNINNLIKRFNNYHESREKSFKCFRSRFLPGSPSVSSEKEALEVLEEQYYDKKQRFSDCYSNSKAEFFLKGLNVYAIINASSGGFYIVYENNEEGIDWYRRALLIVKETITYVIKQKDSDKYFLRWSG